MSNIYRSHVLVCYLFGSNSLIYTTIKSPFLHYIRFLSEVGTPDLQVDPVPVCSRLVDVVWVTLEVSELFLPSSFPFFSVSNLVDTTVLPKFNERFFD